MDSKCHYRVHKTLSWSTHTASSVETIVIKINFNIILHLYLYLLVGDYYWETVTGW
jgi:hypothetical protein